MPPPAVTVLHRKEVMADTTAETRSFFFEGGRRGRPFTSRYCAKGARGRGEPLKALKSSVLKKTRLEESKGRGLHRQKDFFTLLLLLSAKPLPPPPFIKHTLPPSFHHHHHCVNQGRKKGGMSAGRKGEERLFVENFISSLSAPFYLPPPFSPWPRRRREGREEDGALCMAPPSLPVSRLRREHCGRQPQQSSDPTVEPTVPAGKVAAALPSPFFFSAWKDGITQAAE